MKRLLLVLGLLTIGGLAIAQQSVQLRPGDQGPIVWGVNGAASVLSPITFSGAASFPNHVLNTGTAPTPSACGGAGLALVGSDAGGTVTVGSTLTTSCTITFATPWAAAPACVVSPASGVLAAFSYTVSTTAIVVTQTSTASNTIQYICVGKQ